MEVNAAVSGEGDGEAAEEILSKKLSQSNTYKWTECEKALRDWNLQRAHRGRSGAGRTRDRKSVV